MSATAFFLASKLPVRKKLVMFESFSGKQYSCNPRAIYEYMRENYAEYDLVWSVNKKHQTKFKENGIPYVERLSVKWFILMARSAYWVTNSRMPNWVKKPRHTTYVQTWHGTPLKKLVSDMDEVRMPGTTKEKYVENFHREALNWDYLISPNSYSTTIFKRAFKYSNRILETGYPRNDMLVLGNNEETINNIKRKFNIPSEKKVLLYAPTWRDHHNKGPGSYHFNMQLDINAFKHAFSDEYVLLLRMHSFISDKLAIEEDEFVKDVSAYYDINELYLISDMLITDYSSVFFDYAILNRPILFFAYDLDEYRDDIRGFYFQLEKQAPGPIVKTSTELIEAIKEMKQVEGAAFSAFSSQFCSLEDGQATKRVVDELFGESKGVVR